MSDDLLSGPEPGPDELRAIVARASRRRWRGAGAAAAVALLAGGGIGYAVSNHSGGSQTVDAGSSSPSSTVPFNGPVSGASGVSGSGASSAGVAMPALSSRLTRLFVRTAGGVTIRGYTTSVPTAIPPTSCFVVPGFEAEVSSNNTVGDVAGQVASSGSTQPIKIANGELIGQAEQDPVYVVVVNTTAQVAELKMTFPHGQTDQMAPVQSWAALAAEFPASDLPAAGTLSGPVGTLQALGSSGQVLQTMTVNLGFNPVIQPGPGCLCPPIRTGGGAVVGGGSSRSAAGGGAIPMPAIACAQAPPTQGSAPVNPPSVETVPAR